MTRSCIAWGMLLWEVCLCGDVLGYMHDDYMRDIHIFANRNSVAILSYVGCGELW